jgi:hypothetical protein
LRNQTQFKIGEIKIPVYEPYEVGNYRAHERKIPEKPNEKL